MTRIPEGMVSDFQFLTYFTATIRIPISNPLAQKHIGGDKKKISLGLSQHHADVS